MKINHDVDQEDGATGRRSLREMLQKLPELRASVAGGAETTVAAVPMSGATVD